MYPSIEHNTVQFNKGVLLCPNDRVFIPVLRVTHYAKCFSPCVYSYFHRTPSNNFILSQKMPKFGLYEYKIEGLAVGSIENGASLRMIHNLL